VVAGYFKVDDALNAGQDAANEVGDQYK